MSEPETPAAELVPAPAGELTVSCPECTETFTGPKAGPRGANFQLARHRKAAHKVEGKKQRARAEAREARQAGPDAGDNPRGQRVLSAVTEIGEAVGRRKGVPTADDLANGLGRGLGLSTMAIASFVVESDPYIAEGPQGNATREALIDHLSLENRAAVNIMKPVGRALAPTSLNRKYGRAVVDNVDLAASISELGILAMHWRKYMRERAAMSARIAGGMAQPAMMPAPPPAPWAPTHDPDLPPPPGAATTPAPTAGIIVTPEMVAQLQQERTAQ